MHLMAGTYQLKDEEEGRFTSLRELFEISSGVFISIDLKETSNDLCEKVAQLVKEFNRQDLTFWGSMYSE